MNKINRVYCTTGSVHNIISLLPNVLPMHPVLRLSALMGASEALTLRRFHSDPLVETMTSLDGK